MKNFKTVVFTVIALVFSLNVVTAQSNKNAENPKESAESVEKTIDKKVEVLKHKMNNASPEEQQKIRQEMEAYKINRSKDYRVLESSKGYEEIRESKIKIEKSLNAINEAELRLEQAIKNNELTESEIASKREKIAKAKLELKEADEAINRKSKLLDEKRRNKY